MQEKGINIELDKEHWYAQSHKDPEQDWTAWYVTNKQSTYRFEPDLRKHRRKHFFNKEEAVDFAILKNKEDDELQEFQLPYKVRTTPKKWAAFEADISYYWERHFGKYQSTDGVSEF